MKILIACKESSQFVIKSMLEELHVSPKNIHCTDRIDVAMELAVKLKPDLAICGYVFEQAGAGENINSLNGLNLASAIKGAESSCKVLLVSTLKPDHIDLFLECKQIDGFFQKGANIQELLPYLSEQIAGLVVGKVRD